MTNNNLLFFFLFFIISIHMKAFIIISSKNDKTNKKILLSLIHERRCNNSKVNSHLSFKIPSNNNEKQDKLESGNYHSE